MPYTILHQTENGESLHEVNSVTVAQNDVTGFKTLYGHAAGYVTSIDSGDVFVMNENGKTVATYRFGDPRKAERDQNPQEANMKAIHEAGSTRGDRDCGAAWPTLADA